MKTIALIARVLLGFVFLIFGANGFFHFIPAPPPTGLAGDFLTVLSVSHYVVPIFLLQTTGGFLLLINRYVPIALVLLGPVLVNILLFHALLAPQGLPMAIVVAVLYLIVYWRVRLVFSPIFISRITV